MPGKLKIQSPYKMDPPGDFWSRESWPVSLIHWIRKTVKKFEIPFHKRPEKLDSHASWLAFKKVE